MRKILTVLALVGSVLFTACSHLDVSAESNTIAVYNSSNERMVIIPLDKDGNENIDEAVILRPKFTVRMTFSAVNETTMVVVNPTIFKTETGIPVVSGARWYKLGIFDGRCYNYSYSDNRVKVSYGDISIDKMNSIRQGTLVKDSL